MQNQKTKIDPTWAKFKLTFGKYKGYNIYEVLIKDPEYLKWVAREFTDDSVKSAAIAVLQGNSIPKDKVSFDATDGKIIISCPYSAKDICGNLSIRNWDSDLKKWVCPSSIAQEVIDVFKDYDVKTTNNFKAERDRIDALRETSNAVDSDFEMDEEFGSGKSLYPYQQTGAKFIEMSNGNCMINDTVGLGKSAQALSFLYNHPEIRPAVIVCPASVKYQWDEYCREWIPGCNPQIINGAKEKITGDIIILNYDILKRNLIKLQNVNPQIVIFDESHKCFPYNTKVITENGEMNIGDIIENEMKIKVVCYDIKNNKFDMQPITHYFKNKVYNLLRITHKYGEIACTPNHKIWTKEHGYIEAERISKGSHLRMVRWDILDTFPILREEEILLQQLRSKMEDDTTRPERNVSKSDKKSTRSNSRKKTPRYIRKDEEEQSHARSGNTSEDDSNFTINRARNFREKQRWERKTITNTTTNIIRPIRKQLASRICRVFRITTKRRIPYKLQNRYSEPRTYDRNRSRRNIARRRKSKENRHEERFNVSFSRVENIEIQKQRNNGRHIDNYEKDQYVYNIEVNKQHNYFANNILVSNCKNYKSQRTIAAVDLASGIPHRMLLSGTPALNRTSELWMQLGIVRPDIYNRMTFTKWHKKYCDAKKTEWGWDYSGNSNTEELAEELKFIMLRRTEEEVFDELPEMIRSTVPVSITNRKVYNTARKNHLRWIAEQKGLAAAEKASRAEHLSRIAVLKRLAAEGKLQSVISWLRDYLENEDKIVVFAHHKSIISDLKEEFGDECVVIDGDTPQKDRIPITDRFESDPNIKILIGNMKAASEGLNLGISKTVVHLEFDWSPKTHEQCEGRIKGLRQMGRGRTTTHSIYIVGLDTIDIEIIYMLETKRKVIDTAMDDDVRLDFDFLAGLVK